MIPYARHSLDASDIRAVTRAMRAPHLTQGPTVAAFEKALARVTGASHVVAFANGTIALLGMYASAGIKEGDEVLVPSVTFAATATALLWIGARPVLCDVAPDTGLLDPADVARRITRRTRAIVAVDLAGQPADYDAFEDLARRKGLLLLSDGCHALGASWKGVPVGRLAAMTSFSFHPAKGVTTAEGGAVATGHREWAETLRRFRDHGLVRPPDRLAWRYRLAELGLNGRLSDLQAALGVSQLRRLRGFLAARRRIARAYDSDFRNDARVRPLTQCDGARSAYHLYVVRVPQRDAVLRALRRRGIGVQVHYIPLHLQPLFRGAGGRRPGAEEYYRQCLSLPCYMGLIPRDRRRVVRVLREEVYDAQASRSKRQL